MSPGGWWTGQTELRVKWSDWLSQPVSCTKAAKKLLKRAHSWSNLRVTDKISQILKHLQLHINLLTMTTALCPSLHLLSSEEAHLFPLFMPCLDGTRLYTMNSIILASTTVRPAWGSIKVAFRHRDWHTSSNDTKLFIQRPLISSVGRGRIFRT